MTIGSFKGTATATAIAHLTGVLGLAPEGCTITDDGTATWHLRHDLVVSCSIHDGMAHWHLDREPVRPTASIPVMTETPPQPRPPDQPDPKPDPPQPRPDDQ
jgi:hypothetical protein